MPDQQQVVWRCSDQRQTARFILSGMIIYATAVVGHTFAGHLFSGSFGAISHGDRQQKD
jgi:hypothetical protein